MSCRLTTTSMSNVNTTCDRPTTDTRAGSPAAKARVRNIWPTLAVSPIPSSRATASGS
jgi:hypothetical protein